MAKKYVYLFSEGNASMRELLGGKGANLADKSWLAGSAGFHNFNRSLYTIL